MDQTSRPDDAPGWGASNPQLETAAPPLAAGPTRRGEGLLSYVVVAVITACLAGGIAFAAGIGVGAGVTAIATAPPVPGMGHATTPGEPDGFKLFWEAWDVLKEHYVDQRGLTGTAVTYGAIRGLTQAIGDTDHTRFLTPDELARQQQDLSGKIAGVGALLSSQGDSLIVQSVIPGAPAERSGVRPGDRILAVDGKDIAGKSVDEVVALVRGAAGTQVTLTLLRKNQSAPFDVRITRAVITVPAVTWALYPGSTTAVVRLEQFSQGSGDQMVQALKDARAGGATRIVFDLRSNPGGYVNEAVKVASQFVGNGNVYLSQDAKGARTAVPVVGGGVALDLPVVVLVDSGSASAAEIVSGAIQDSGRGPLVGEKTFGTGTVLSQFNLSDGSALLVGTIEWLTRDGHQIWKQGIVPTVIVALPQDGRIVVPSEFATLGATGIAAAKDAQLQKAIELAGTK